MPTSVDPSLTDDGSTVLTMFTQYGPYREEDWPEGAREAYAERCFDLLAEHAPNVKDALVHYEVLAPPDLERIFGLVDGSIFQGEQGLDQMAFMRPSPLLAQYATPVDGLYLCGAGTHPGGGVMGACGHNAAQRVLKDRRSRARRRVFLSRLDDAEERRAGIGPEARGHPCQEAAMPRRRRRHRNVASRASGSTRAARQPQDVDTSGPVRRIHVSLVQV